MIMQNLIDFDGENEPDRDDTIGNGELFSL